MVYADTCVSGLTSASARLPISLSTGTSLQQRIGQCKLDSFAPISLYKLESTLLLQYVFNTGAFATAMFSWLLDAWSGVVVVYISYAICPAKW
jgi:hypothetical protein